MVIDSSVLVAIFRKEPEAASFVDLVDEADFALISVVTVVETIFGRDRGRNDARALRSPDRRHA
jgi:uncharacterized protein with PIN domain